MIRKEVTSDVWRVTPLMGLIGYPLTEIIRLRIPKIAVQAETGEDGTHLIWLRTTQAGGC